MPRKITPIPLSRKSFQAYGDVIEAKDDRESRLINEGNTIRYHNLANLDLTDSGGNPTINIFRSQPLAQPLILKLMERHPLSSQSFFPLGQTPYLVVVAPPGELEPGAIVAFLAQPGQGVNYHRGTWHHYSLSLVEPSDFLVIDRDAPDKNCDEIELNETDWIEIKLESGV